MARYSVITGSFIICICLMNAGHAAPSSTGTKPPHLAFPNGRWFDGTGFIEATFYAVDGVLTDQRPKRVDRPTRAEAAALRCAVPLRKGGGCSH